MPKREKMKPTPAMIANDTALEARDKAKAAVEKNNTEANQKAYAAARDKYKETAKVVMAETFVRLANTRAKKAKQAMANFGSLFNGKGYIITADQVAKLKEFIGGATKALNAQMDAAIGGTATAEGEEESII